MSKIKVCIGLRGNDINKKNFILAKQLGVDGLVLTMFQKTNVINTNSPFYGKCYNIVRDNNEYSEVNFKKVKQWADEVGIEIFAIENFSPIDIYDILLDGQCIDQQIKKINNIIKNISSINVHMIGFGFNIGGVCGRKHIFGRGNSEILEFSIDSVNKMIPNGVVWDTIYNEYPQPGFVHPISKQQVQERFFNFVNKINQTCKDYNITLSLHPTDPPMDNISGIARLVTTSEDIFNIINNPIYKNHKITYCVGTFAEMNEQQDNVYKSLVNLIQLDKVGYIHIRNVIGKVPKYKEVFIDEGDVNLKKIINILKQYNYNGFIMPDHTPTLLCDNNFFVGMAFSIGYIKGLIE